MEFPLALHHKQQLVPQDFASNFGLPEETLEKILSIEIIDDIIQRARVVFKNTYQLSIITGIGAFCDHIDKKYEIAVMDKDGCFITKDLFQCDDIVIGYLTKENVKELITLLANFDLSINSLKLLEGE